MWRYGAAIFQCWWGGTGGAVQQTGQTGDISAHKAACEHNSKGTCPFRGNAKVGQGSDRVLTSLGKGDIRGLGNEVFGLGAEATR